jgi:hypothetical protein
LIANRRNRQLAGADGRSVEMDGAGATLGHTAAVFGAGQVEVVAQYPQHRRGWVYVHQPAFTVDFKTVLCHVYYVRMIRNKGINVLPLDSSSFEWNLAWPDSGRHDIWVLVEREIMPSKLILRPMGGKMRLKITRFLSFAVGHSL